MDKSIIIECFLMVLLTLSIDTTAIDTPLEEPSDNFTIDNNDTSKNITVFVYSTEEVRLYETENSTSLLNWPTINSSQELGYQKFKSMNRLLYLNETSYDGNISFILTLRKGINSSKVDNLETDYDIDITTAFFKSTTGGGVTEYPPDEEVLDVIEEAMRDYSSTYHNITNFTLVEEYHSFRVNGNISNIMELLYDNNTFCIDPGPYDLINDYPNATFLPTSHLHYGYISYTTCNGSLRTNETDVDGDLYLVCEGDCNDSNKSIHPGATEIKDGIDNDCDGLVDEGLECIGSDPPFMGDWIINQQTECIDVNIFLSWKSLLQFINNQTLTLNNTVVHLNESDINLGDGGTLVLDNSVIVFS